MDENNVKKIREAKMLSKAELVARQGSLLTIDRIEKGNPVGWRRRENSYSPRVKFHQKQRVFE